MQGSIFYSPQFSTGCCCVSLVELRSPRCNDPYLFVVATKWYSESEIDALQNASRTTHHKHDTFHASSILLRCCFHFILRFLDYKMYVVLSGRLPMKQISDYKMPVLCFKYRSWIICCVTLKSQTWASPTCRTQVQFCNICPLNFPILWMEWYVRGPYRLCMILANPLCQTMYSPFGKARWCMKMLLLRFAHWVRPVPLCFDTWLKSCEGNALRFDWCGEALDWSAKQRPDAQETLN